LPAPPLTHPGFAVPQISSFKSKKLNQVCSSRLSLYPLPCKLH
jgi:hypothetical protein